MACMCISDGEKILSDANFDLKNMVGAVNHVNKREERQQKELFNSRVSSYQLMKHLYGPARPGDMHYFV